MKTDPTINPRNLHIINEVGDLDINGRQLTNEEQQKVDERNQELKRQQMRNFR